MLGCGWQRGGQGLIEISARSVTFNLRGRVRGYIS